MREKCDWCDCTIVTRSIDEGCAICNPDKALEYAYDDIKGYRAENERMLEVIQDLVMTFAAATDKGVESMGVSALAEGMRVLSDHGLMTLKRNDDRFVVGTLNTEPGSEK